MEQTFLAIAVLFGLGLYIILTHQNLIKIAMGIGVMESAIILLFIILSYRPGGTAPILDADAQAYDLIVDPIPQALSLTAIVIGAGTTALMLALIIKIYNRYNTLYIDEIKKLKG
ncbi:cation:proton antiporter subunit C [Natroniella sulfidigena]|uniref:sodium:proton antiporter n=1 Tax=Natroniella sulfidigena TaxID=723921 RepID=UPI00200B394E|nr:cation:proton antiporter subunit C [Natroniella sulfidigena]